MRIGEVAQLAGVSARSIRHYHQLGALAEPARTSGGYREYDVADLARVVRIAFLNSSGVPLREVSALLAADNSGTGSGMATDLAAIRAGIDEQISSLIRQRDRLDVIAQRTAEGLPLGLLPEPVSRSLNICRDEVADDPELLALLDRERDMLDLVALNGKFPEALTASYVAIGSDPARRHQYLALLRGFHLIEGRRPASVENEIARLVDTLLADDDLRRLVAGNPPDSGSTSFGSTVTSGSTGVRDSSGPNDSSPGPTLEQLLPDPAQREVLRRTLTALGILR